MTATLVDDSPDTTFVVRVSILCTTIRPSGVVCNAVLCRVDLSRWEEVTTNAREDKCDRCGRVYTLAEYR